MSSQNSTKGSNKAIVRLQSQCKKKISGNLFKEMDGQSILTNRVNSYK